MCTPTHDDEHANLKEAKGGQRETWNKFAAAYTHWSLELQLAQGLFDQFAGALEQRLGNARPVQVLDVASASGEPALTIARRLTQAHVWSTDLAEAFLELGKARAERAGLAGRVTFQTADAEELSQFQDCSMDAVTCSMEPWQNPIGCSSRGGVLVLAVWQALPRVPYLQTVLELCHELDPELPVAAHIACKFGDPQASELMAGLQAAGFGHVAREELSCELALAAGVWWECLLGLPLPLGRLLSKLEEQGDPHAHDRAKARMQAILKEKGWLTPEGGLRIPGNICHFIVAEKA